MYKQYSMSFRYEMKSNRKRCQASSVVVEEDNILEILLALRGLYILVFHIS
jgi:hypothetical protein